MQFFGPPLLRLTPKTNAITVAVVFFLFASPSFGQESSPEAIEQYRAAVALQNQQLYDLAAEEWQVFAKKFKDDPYIGNAQHYLGVCYFQTEDYAKADKSFEAALAANARFEAKGEVAAATTLLSQGLAQFNLAQATQGAGRNEDKRKFDNAIKTLKRLKSEFGGSDEAAEGNYYLAESLFAIGRKDEARELYEQTVNNSPKHPQRDKLLYALGVAYQEAGEANKARETFSKLRNEFPSSEFGDEIATREGDALFAAKQYGEAAKAFAVVAMNADSKFADYALVQQAACDFKQKKYAEAGKRYASVVERFPKSEYAKAATLSAGKCLHLGNDPRAEKWLAKASTLKGLQGLEAVHWLARVKIQNEKAADAIGPLEKAINTARKNKKAKDILPQLQLDLADALFENKESRTDAAKLYESVASEFPDHEAAPQARYMAAFTALDRSEHEEAREQAKRFLSKWPKSDLRADVLAIAAESQLQLGEHDKAGKQFEELVNKYAKRPECESWISRRAICLNRDKKHNEVIQWLNSRMNDIQSAEAKGESQFLLGSAYLSKGNTNKATQSLQASLDASPKGLQSDRALLLLGEAHQKSDKPELALASIRRLLQEHPKSSVAGQARFREAELLYAQGDFKTATKAYETVLKNKGQSELHPSALFGLAWSQLSVEDYDSAATTLNRLTKDHADHELSKKARYAMGVAYQQKEEFDKAIDSLNIYLKGKLNKTDKADALYLRGLCLVGRDGEGDLKKATSDFNAVTTTDPKYADAEQVLYEMAWAYQDADKADEAAGAFRKLAEQFPQSALAAESWYRVAENDYQNKKFAEATQSYQRSLDRAKEQPEIAERAAHKLGWANYQQKQYTEAAHAFRHQLQQTGDGELAPTAKLMAAECAYQEKDFQRALDGFQSAMPSANGVSDSLRALSLLHAGQAAAQLKQWQPSADMLQKCAEEFPDSSTIHQTRYELAFALQNLGESAKAKSLFEQVATATNTPVGARARFMLGELQFAENDYNGAIRTFAKVFSGYGGEKAPKPYRQWQADALFEAARCCESTKRIDSAKRFYQQLISDYPESDKVKTARNKLNNLGN